MATGLINEALRRKVAVDVMERLLSMQDRVAQTHARELYIKALARFQANCPVVPKRKVVLNKESKGGGVRYKYAPLEDIIAVVGPELARNGFCFMVKGEQGKDSYTAIAEGYHTGGHREESRFTVPIVASDYMTAPQSVASAQTFAKRQAFCNLWGIVTADTDDDGRGGGVVSENGAKAAQRKQPAAVPEDAAELVRKQLGDMTWLPAETRQLYEKQLQSFIAKTDARSVRGLAQALSRQIALKKGEKA